MQLIDPPQGTSAAIQDLTFALTAVSLFIGPLGELSGEAEGLSSSISAVKEFGGTIQNAIETEKSLQEFLYPTGGSASSQLVEIADLKDDLVTVIDAAMANVA